MCVCKSFFVSQFQDLVSQLQNQVTSYKRQVEEAEEIAALNLAKFREVAEKASEAQERADLAELALARLRTKGLYKSTVIETFQLFLLNQKQDLRTGIFEQTNLIIKRPGLNFCKASF